MHQARAVLMDIDGTLLESADAQAHCWLTVLHEFGYRVEFRQVRARIGMGPDRILHDLCGLSEASARAGRLLAIRSMLVRTRVLPHVRVFPRAKECLERVQSSGAKLAVVTSAPRAEALASLAAAQLLTAFDHVVCKEDLTQTKPAPDCIRFALDTMGVRPDQTLFVGSSPYDLAAARGARVPCVALRSGGWPESALLGSSHAYQDLADLLQQLQRAPLAMDARQLSAPTPFVWREPVPVRRAVRSPSPHAA